MKVIYVFLLVLIILIIFLVSFCFLIQKKHRKSKIYVNFTTIPSRISSIEPVIKSLVNQTEKISKIFINIPRKYIRFKEKVKIPEFLEKYKSDVEIFYLDNDYGPLTKVIGPLINEKIGSNDIILITDDDRERDSEWAANLVNSIKKNPKSITTFQYFNSDIIWGTAGFGFIKTVVSLKELKNFFLSVKNQCLKVDDHLLTAYAKYKKIPILGMLHIKDKEIDLPDKLVDSGRKKDSEICRRAIYDEYGLKFPFWCCKDCCPSSSLISDII